MTAFGDLAFRRRAATLVARPRLESGGARFGLLLPHGQARFWGRAVDLPLDREKFVVPDACAAIGAALRA